MTTYTIGLVVHPRADVSASVQTILAWARTHDGDVVAGRSQAARVGDDVRLVEDADLPDVSDGLVALGGDGTMLGAMRLVVGHDVPVLGINHGTLGFLVEVGPGELPVALDRLSTGDFSLEEHDCLRVRTADGTAHLAFNDVVLARDGVTGAATLELTLGGVRYGYYRADALVLATAIGSTAYSYAAGGPVVSPGCDVMVVTPVAPISGISRALVLDARESLDLAVARASDCVVLLADGLDVGRLAPGATVRVEAVPDAAKVVRIDAAGHARRSRVKLSLLDLPLEPDQLLEMVPEHLRHVRAPGH